MSQNQMAEISDNFQTRLVLNRFPQRSSYTLVKAMGEKTLNNSLRLEVNDPRGSTDWRPLWGLDGERCEEDQVLADKVDHVCRSAIPDAGIVSVSKKASRVLLSLVLIITIATLFNPRSFAASEPRFVNPSAVDPDYTGMLLVKSGTVTLNGNTAQTGATVLNGAAVSTSARGSAVIDLGAVGRVGVGNNTTVTVYCTAATIEVKSSCSNKTEVKVISGAVDIKAPKTETLAAGQKKVYDGSVDLAAVAGSSLEVECEGGRRAVWLLVGPGLVGVLALLGAGMAVAAGVIKSSGSAPGDPPVSPCQ
jgi:hypothetical protein